MVDALNEEWLPESYFAEEMITVGGRVEIDVATFEESSEQTESNGVVAVARRTWTPPAPMMTMPGVFPASFSVKVYSSEGGPTLVGAIELISPGNKDCAEHRQAFAIKCANYLHQGIGVVIVDIVTSRRANLHNAVIQLLGQAPAYRMSDDCSLYSVAYRPATRENRDEIDLWLEPLSLGDELPTMPLALRNAGAIALELEATYSDVCRRRHL